MALSGRRYRRRKKETVFTDGYFIDTAVDVSPGVDRQDETFHVYGKDSPDLDVQHNFGTLSIAILDKFTNNALLDLANGYDPASTAPREYNVDRLTGVHVFANVKDQLNTQYVKSWIVEDWVPGMPLPSGDPNAKAQWTITGNGGLPRIFEGAWIKTAKVNSGTPTMSDTPVLVPGTTDIYAVSVKAIDESGGGFEQENVIPSAAMVDSAGAVDFSEIEGQVQDLTAVTDALVFYLQTGTGIYPTVVMGQLRD